jgi:signal transduction histidine kinase
MNIQSLSALLAAIVTFAIGSSVLLRDRRQPPFRRFAVLCFVLCVWHIAVFLKLTLDAEWAYFLSLYGAVAIPVATARFFRPFLTDEAQAKMKVTPRSLAGIGIGWAIAITYCIAFRQLGLHRMLVFKAPLFAYSIIGLYVSMVSVYRKYRRTLAPGEKTSLLYMTLGGAAAITLVGADQVPLVGPALNALGNIITIIYMYFISQTLFRYRLLDVNEVLGKMVVLSTLVLILASIYGMLVAWVPPAYTGVFFFNTLVASFVILILFDPLRSVIEGPIQKWMFRERFELRKLVEELRGALANVIDLKEAVRLTLNSMEESRRATHGSIYLLDADGGFYDLLGFFGAKPADRVDAVQRRVFFERLQATRQPVSVEQLEREHAERTAHEQETETLDAIARALAEMNAALCIPLVAEDQVIGLCNLRDERLREAYATDEVDLFRGVAAQMAIIIQNTKLYDRMKERDRLAALGEMAAGLAHEIRNPLGAIKGAAQLLLPPAQSGDTPESGQAPVESQQFLSIIVEEANRLNRVVSQFLDYARPFRGELAPLDLNDVVRKTAALVTPPPLGDSEPKPIEVVLSLGEDLPRVRADAEQLRQVFLNLAINAVQAMTDRGEAAPTPDAAVPRRDASGHGGGKLIISTSLRKGGRRGAPAQFLEVRFRDNGPGIPQNVIRNLFIPFFTTKEKGTGLGLPISQRIIENHGGTIEVRSRLGTGTTFTVVLPAVEAGEKREEKSDKVSASMPGI